METQKKVLIVEDSPTQQLLLKHKFTEAGYDVEIAEDGLVALMQLRQTRPDLLIADYVLPGMDGLELCKEIRSMVNLRTLPIIMTTEARDNSLFDKARDLGINRYIPKDEGPDFLVIQANQLLEEDKNTPPYILIVEDSLTQAASLKYLLEKNGFAAVNCANAKAAIEEIEKDKPSIILSDIRMPEISGLEFCRKLKADPKYNTIPIILMTSLSSTKDVIEAMVVGADYYFPKPYKPEFLVEKLRAILSSEGKDFAPVKPFEYEFGTTTYSLPADRVKIMDMMFTTLEIASDQNHDLNLLQLELRRQRDFIEEATTKWNNSLKSEIDRRNELNIKLEKQSSILAAVSQAATELNYQKDTRKNINDLLENICQHAGFVFAAVMQKSISSKGDKLYLEKYSEHLLTGLLRREASEELIVEMDAKTQHILSALENNQIYLCTRTKLPSVMAKQAQELGFEHATIIPITVNENLWGLLTLGSERQCDPELLEVARIATNFIGSTIQHECDRQTIDRAVEKETNIGMELQQKLLITPPLTDIKGLEIGQAFISAGDISGDFVEYFKLSDTCLDIAIADVAGKGISAGLLGANIKSALAKAHHVCSFKPAFKPANIINLLHSNVLDELHSIRKIVTMAYCRLDTATGEMSITDCGHPHLLKYSAKKKQCEDFVSHHIPLGADETHRYDQQNLTVSKGDILVFYSDGVINSSDHLTNQQRKDIIRQLVTENPDNQAQPLADMIKSKMEEGQQDIYHDDIAIIVAIIK